MRIDNFKGTKGEWLAVPTLSVTETGEPLYYNVETKDPYKHIGSVSGYNVPGYEEHAVSREESKANAVLFAAAPEMLYMLQCIADGVAVEDTDINILIHKATSI